jgi:Spy/CpxP family protein refolding chaperone
MKSTKTSIALAAIACLLALSPSVRAQTNAASRPTSPAGRRDGGVMTVESRLNRLTEQLKLTDEQKPKVKAVLEEQDKQRQAARDLSAEERRSKMQAMREETNKKMKEILTAEQFKKFEDSQQMMRGQRRERPSSPSGAAEKPQVQKDQM